MENSHALIANIEKIHTTDLAAVRIKRNLKLELPDVVKWCAKKIEQSQSIIRKGKNWYVYIDGVVITINAHSYTIITAHRGAAFKPGQALKDVVKK